MISALVAHIAITELPFSLNTSFEVTENQSAIARIEKRLFSFSKIFDLKDRADTVIATMAIQIATPILFWGDIGDVMDQKGCLIGKIREEIFDLSPWHEYHLINEEEKHVATARLDLWGLSMEVTPPNALLPIYAKLKLPYYRCVRNEWEMEILDDQIDRRLLIFLPIFHSDLHR